MLAWPRRLSPKNIKATPETSIILSGTPLGEPSEKKVFVRAGFQPRNIKEVVAYDRIIQKRNKRFAYHLFGLDRFELESRRRFELNASLFSY